MVKPLSSEGRRLGRSRGEPAGCFSPQAPGQESGGVQIWSFLSRNFAFQDKSTECFALSERRLSAEIPLRGTFG